MGARASSYENFRRCLATGDSMRVRAAAAELPGLTLADALRVTFVLLADDPHAYPRAAARWHGRLCLQARRTSPSERGRSRRPPEPRRSVGVGFRRVKAGASLAGGA